MLWLIFTSYRRNRRKYLYAILSLILTTFLATISIGSLVLAASIWRKPILIYGGGHILLFPSEPEGTWSLFYPNRVFDGDKAGKIVKSVFPEASITSTLVVPATYVNKTGETGAMSIMKHIAGRSDNLDSWYLFPEVRRGRPLQSVPATDPTIVCSSSYGPRGAGTVLPDAEIRIAEYAGTDYPWQMTDVETQTLKVAGTHNGTVYRVYMRLEALRTITGCPDNIVSMIGIALPGIQHKTDAGKVEQLKARLSEEMPELEVITLEDIGRAQVSDVRVLDEAPRKYLPIVYAMSFAVVAAIVASIAHSRRYELHLLHVIGLSRNQVRLLFATECVIASVFAGLIGYLPLSLLGRFALGTNDISLLPLTLTLVGSVLIAVLRSAFLLGGKGHRNGIFGEELA